MSSGDFTVAELLQYFHADRLISGSLRAVALQYTFRSEDDHHQSLP